VICLKSYREIGQPAHGVGHGGIGCEPNDITRTDLWWCQCAGRRRGDVLALDCFVSLSGVSWGVGRSAAPRVDIAYTTL
jgi:hypothetical protein